MGFHPQPAFDPETHPTGMVASLENSHPPAPLSQAKEGKQGAIGAVQNEVSGSKVENAVPHASLDLRAGRRFSRMQALEHDGFVAVNDHTILQVRLDRAGQHAAFDVPPDAG